jgi:hypothetical protein
LGGLDALNLGRVHSDLRDRLAEIVMHAHSWSALGKDILLKRQLKKVRALHIIHRHRILLSETGCVDGLVDRYWLFLHLRNTPNGYFDILPVVVLHLSIQRLIFDDPGMVILTHLRSSAVPSLIIEAQLGDGLSQSSQIVLPVGIITGIFMFPACPLHKTFA